MIDRSSSNVHSNNIQAQEPSILDFSERTIQWQEGREGGKKKRCYRFTRPDTYRLGQEVSEVRRRNKTGVELARGGSDFVHCHCNFLAGRSFRGVTHHGGITYRWLFVRTSPSVIICLVTRPLTAYIFAQFSLPSPSIHFHPEPPLSLCFEPCISTLYRRI